MVRKNQLPQFPNDYLNEKALSLPSSVSLSDPEIEQVVGAIKNSMTERE